MDYQDIEPNRVEHMQLIQEVIGRLSNDSFLVKGWAITVAGVFFGFAVSAENGHLALVSVVPSLLFWTLDTYYLWSERLFRLLYEAVRVGRDGLEPFYMDATSDRYVATAKKSGDEVPDKADIFISATLWRFYGALILSAVVLAAAICLS